MDPQKRILLLGDVLALVVFTLVGFATHSEMNAGLRMLTTFLPALAAWVVAAPWLGLYRLDTARRPRQIWRVSMAALLAAPLAAWLRGVWLNAPILPVFVLVLVVSLAIAFTIWRGLWLLWFNRQVQRG